MTAIPRKRAVFDKPIPFIDLAAQRARLGTTVDDAVLRVVNHGSYIMGPEVKQFEAGLSEFCGATHSIGCSNGTDALAMVLRAWDIGVGDAVLVPSFTFAATAEVVAQVGATPVFCDIGEETFNMDTGSLTRAIDWCASEDMNARAVIPVDLFGLPADYDALLPIAQDANLKVLCDGAQSFGARHHNKMTGTIGDATTTSFFPAKPLGCYGDGGAIFTDDTELAEVLESIRVHGKGTHKYDNVRIGGNFRLDTIQAAILLEKLKIFPDEIAARQRVAAHYAAGLSDVADTPTVPDGLQSAWAQYTIRVANRDDLAAKLRDKGVPTAVYYPLPLHQQTAYKTFPVAPGGLPISERLADEVISLPMHPYLDAETQDYIIDAVRQSLA